MQNSSLQQQAKILFHHKVMSENLELQRKQRLLRTPINNVPFHKVVEEFCTKQIDLKSDNDSEIISRLLQLQHKSRKEIQALQKAFGLLKFFNEAQDYLAKKEFEGLLQEIQYERFKKFQTVFEFDELGFKYYIILKGSVFVQIPNKNFKKYEDKSRLQLDLKQASKNSGNTQNPKTSSRNNSSDSISSASSSDSEGNVNSPMKLPHNSNKNSKSKMSGKNDFKSYFQFQEQGSAPNKSIDDIHKSHNPNARKSVILAINTIKQVNKFANKLKQEKEKSIFSNNLKVPSKNNKSPRSKSNIDEEDASHSQIQITVDPKERITSLYPQYDIVRELSAGDAFGEIALINNARRTASIICKEDTTLAVLSKQSYDKILSQYHQAEQEKNISFLKEFTIFNQLGKSKLDALFRIMERQEYKRNQIIYSEGEPAKYVYFIKEGEVEVSQQCVQHNNQKKAQDGDPEYVKMMQNYNLKYKGQQQKESLKRIKIAILGKNNYFGQEEIISNIPRLYRTEVFTTSAVIYSLPKQKFLGTVKLFQYSMDTMQKELSKRATWRINQLEKNLTTNKKIDNEQQKAQDEIAKFEFAEQTLKEKPEVVTQFIGSELDAMQKEHLEKDYQKYGIIRSEKDVNKINEEIINQLKSKNKKKKAIKVSDSKVKLFKLSLKNNLFQEETDKINQRMKKKIMSPRAFRSFLQQTSQNAMPAQSQSHQVRGEMVKEILQSYEQKNNNTNPEIGEDQIMQSLSKLNIKSLQQLPLDFLQPFNSFQQSPKSQNDSLLRYKSQILINSIQNNNPEQIPIFTSAQSIKDVFPSPKLSLGAKFIHYDVHTPQSLGQNAQSPQDECLSPFQINLNDHYKRQMQQNLIDGVNTVVNGVSKPKRIQSAQPKIGSNSSQATDKHQKLVIFPVQSPRKKNESLQQMHSMGHISHGTNHQDGKYQNNVQAIQEEENDSPLLFYQPVNTNMQNQLFKSLKLSRNSNSIHENPNSNSRQNNKSNNDSESPIRRQTLQGTITSEYDIQELINKQQQILTNITPRNASNQNLSKSLRLSSTIPQQTLQQLQSQSNSQFKKTQFASKSKSICNSEMPKPQQLFVKAKQVGKLNQNVKSNSIPIADMIHSSKRQFYMIQQSKKPKFFLDNNCSINLANQINMTSSCSLLTKRQTELLETKSNQVTSSNQNLGEENNTQEQEQINQQQSVTVFPNSNNCGGQELIDKIGNNQMSARSFSIPVGKPDVYSQLQSPKMDQPDSNKVQPNSTQNILIQDEIQLSSARRRPQSSLIGSIATQATFNKSSYMQNMNSNINSPRKLNRKNMTMSNFCSPISNKDVKVAFEQVGNMSSSNVNVRVSILNTPKNLQVQQQNDQQQPSEFKFESTVNQGGSQNVIRSHKMQSQTNINLNGVSLQDFQYFHSNRSQVVSPSNYQNNILRPRSSKGGGSFQKITGDSKNIHMDKLRFLKKDLDIKDPFKNNNKQYKQLMSTSTKIFSHLQTPKSPHQSYLKTFLNKFD